MKDIMWKVQLKEILKDPECKIRYEDVDKGLPEAFLKATDRPTTSQVESTLDQDRAPLELDLTVKLSKIELMLGQVLTKQNDLDEVVSEIKSNTLQIKSQVEFQTLTIAQLEEKVEELDKEF